MTIVRMRGCIKNIDNDMCNNENNYLFKLIYYIQKRPRSCIVIIIMKIAQRSQLYESLRKTGNILLRNIDPNFRILVEIYGVPPLTCF